MSVQPPSTTSREIIWSSVVTVVSAAILIGAEVFGAAFAGGWALAILFGFDDTGAHILQAVLFAIGVLIMAAFIHAAQRVEPFTRRA
jgi:nitric oxide reductase large subunit